MLDCVEESGHDKVEKVPAGRLQHRVHPGRRSEEIVYALVAQTFRSRLLPHHLYDLFQQLETAIVDHCNFAGQPQTDYEFVMNGHLPLLGGGSWDLENGGFVELEGESPERRKQNSEYFPELALLQLEVLLIEQIAQQSHKNKLLDRFGEPADLLPPRELDHITEVGFEKFGLLGRRVVGHLVEMQEGNLNCYGEGLIPQHFAVRVVQSHEDVEDGVRAAEVEEGDGVFGDQEQHGLLHLALEVQPLEFRQAFYLPQQVQDLLRHLFVCEAQVYHVLHERQEQHPCGHAVCVCDLPEQPEADLIGKHRQLLVLEDFAGLYHFLPQDAVLLVYGRCDASQLLAEQRVVVQHMNI